MRARTEMKQVPYTSEQCLSSLNGQFPEEPQAHPSRASVLMAEATEAFAETSLALVETSMATAKRSNAQRQRVLEVARMEEQIQASARQSSVNSRETSERTKAVTREADAGHVTIEQNMSSMQEMVRTISKSAGLMREFVESMQEIKRIVGTVNEIAQQTNFLALNAAIEAAHAGAHGSGFNVIAQEIRSLANRASRSTGEIADRIKQMSDRAVLAEHAMQTGKAAALESIEQNALVQQVFQRIREAIHEVQRMSAEVAAASDQQLASGEKVTEGIYEIDRMAEECTLEADASAEMSIHLTESAAYLDQLVCRDPEQRRRSKGEVPDSGSLLTEIERSRPAVRLARTEMRNKLTSSPSTLKGTVEVGGMEVPALFLGAARADQGTSWIDRLDVRTGCRATIFARSGDAFIRVATSVRRADGQRAVGTRLNPKGRAIKALRDGKSFEGVVYVLGNPFLAAYDPLFSPAGELVGACYVGRPFAS